jgi:hypothetical protein
MTENVRRIRNPLTIIGIFCALAEVGGTVVLPFVIKENQVYYMWFLMIFPVLLVVFFFLTLNFNSKVLYAPSDFQDESNFLKYLQPTPAGSAIKKASAEFEQSKIPITGQDNLLFEAPAATARPGAKTASRKIAEAMTPSAGKVVPEISKERYFFVEELLINKLKTELKVDLSREYQLNIGGQSYQFDAMGYTSDGPTIVDVKVLLSNLLRKRDLIDTLMKMQSAFEALSRRGVAVRGIIAFALSLENEKSNVLKERIQNILANYRFRPEIMYFDIGTLEKEYGLSR